MMESKGGIIMPATKLTEADVARAEQIWADYQRDHDVSDRIGRAAGIDPGARGETLTVQQFARLAGTTPLG